MGWRNTPLWPASCSLSNRVLHCGTQPFAARHALALEGEAAMRRSREPAPRPALRSRASASRKDRLLQSCACGTLCAVNSTGSGEPCSRAGLVQPAAQLFGESLDQQRMVVPLFHEVDGKRRARARTEPACRAQHWSANCAAPGRSRPPAQRRRRPSAAACRR